MTKNVQLIEACELNPRRPKLSREDNTKTSFIQMASVDDRLGIVSNLEIRPYGEIKKGYTYFAERDVLFAKITPCMQNGKHAIAWNLIDGIGFGSTEFHVIRPGPWVISEWIHFYLRQSHVLGAAMATFTGAVGQQRVPTSFLESLEIPIPPLAEQRRIVSRLQAQLAEIEVAQAAALAQREATSQLEETLIRESLDTEPINIFPLSEVTREVKRGIGERWAEYPVLGATREGLALAKEPVGKSPERYKPVTPGTVFYNPMRINIGSIALVDKSDPPGITSPDYVALTCVEGSLHFRWFYHWLRSGYGAAFIKSLARGAVRERMLYNRLAEGEIALPAWETQVSTAEKLAALRPLKTCIAEQMETLQAVPQRLLTEAFASL